jgi:hypothetical protein
LRQKSNGSASSGYIAKDFCGTHFSSTSGSLIQMYGNMFQLQGTCNSQDNRKPKKSLLARESQALESHFSKKRTVENIFIVFSG